MGQSSRRTFLQASVVGATTIAGKQVLAQSLEKGMQDLLEMTRFWI
jgi:hypothetical protein